MKIIIENGLTQRHPTVTPGGIYGFFPPYRWLSNYHMVNIAMPDGLTYPSTENAYQAYKLLDVEARKPFTTYSCGESKKMGQFVRLRSDWEKIKVDVMKTCLEVKFQNPELKEMLMATAPKHLEEANNWGDKYWGTTYGKGENMLGKLLMQIRDKEK